MIISIMAKANKSQTMTDALRQALQEAPSVRAVARATGVQQSSLVRFLSGETSLRLDKADRLAAHFKIKVIREGAEQ